MTLRTSIALMHAVGLLHDRMLMHAVGLPLVHAVGLILPVELSFTILNGKHVTICCRKIQDYNSVHRVLNSCTSLGRLFIPQDMVNGHMEQKEKHCIFFAALASKRNVQFSPLTFLSFSSVCS